MPGVPPCHPERSEGSRSRGGQPGTGILRCAQDDKSPEITVELLPWVPRLVGRDEGRHLRLVVDHRPGETVLRFLQRFSGDYPQLRDELLAPDHRQLREFIEIAINGSVLGIHHQLDSPLQPGDEILLLPRYEGG